MTSQQTVQPQMLVAEFEDLARAAPETVWLEFVNGRLEVKPGADGARSEIVAWLVRSCLQQRPDLSLYTYRGLKVEAHREGRARPDGVLAPRRHIVGHGEWSDPEGMLMAVEVTPRDPEAVRSVRFAKCDGYAAAGIPVYLLVDRDDRTVVVHTEPEAGRYRSLTSRPYGTVIEIPDPVGVTLETEKLRGYGS
ncbi:Uma2 family endonuclease [Streptomyces sp. NPDC005271]|uniref:Uma2 family endonuclease n=1 Tax=unclassified Streptomyces TaxID=2593676 RepID=UPI0033A45B00